MKFDLLAQPTLEADAIAVADDEHSDHQLRVDRGSADVAVERRQLLAKVSQHPRHDWIDAQYPRGLFQQHRPEAVIGRTEIPQRSSLLPKLRCVTLSAGSTGGIGQ